MTLRIILTCADYPTATRWGGIGTYTRHHARALRAAGADVHVLTGATAGAPQLDVDDGIPVHRVVPTTGGDAGLDRDGLATLLTAMVSRIGADVVEAPEYAAPLLSFQRATPSVPVVIRLHGAGTLIREAAQPRWRASIARHSPAMRRLEADERESVERAALVSSPSVWALEALRARGWRIGGNALQVFNAFTPEATLGLGDEARAADTVCIPGRLDRIKGADLLPAIMQGVWAQRPGTQFVSIGQHGERRAGTSWGEWIMDAVPASHRSHVALLGGKAPSEVAALLRTQRVALFASVFETFSYTVVECMSAGLACVVASGGGPRELGRHGTHFLLAPRSPAAIADALVRLLGQPGTVATLGEAAEAHVRDVLASPAVTARVLDAYAGLAGARMHEVAA